MMRTTAIESQAILKVIEVWQNRQVYEEDFLQGLKDKIQSQSRGIEVTDEPQDYLKLSDLPPLQSQLLLTQFSSWLKISELQVFSAENQKRQNVLEAQIAE